MGNLYIYCPQQSWGKVIFSEACVKNSVNRGACMARGVHGKEGVWWGHVWQGWGHAWWGHVWQGGVHRRGLAWQGRVACVAGGMHGRGHAGGCMMGGGAWWGACMADTMRYG